MHLLKAGAGENSVLVCRRCGLHEEILFQEKELWEQEGKLHSIRECKKDVDSIFIGILQRQEHEPVTAQRGQPETAVSCGAGGGFQAGKSR